jgi:mono/diheme cytochrome c family protein
VPGPEKPHRKPLAGKLGTARRFASTGVVILILLASVAFGVWRGMTTRDEGFETADTPAPIAEPTPEPLGEEPRSARELFAHSCGVCHTLRAAGVTGIAGPDLDAVRPPLTAGRVRRQIRTGTLDSAMPPQLLRGPEAAKVSRYVARVAGARS